MERWKQIKGYANYYVSDCGRIRNQHTGQLLTPHANYEGYLVIGLCRQSKIRCYMVHRLVAKAFIPNPKHYPIVNHKDEDRQNDRASNLEWSSQRHNCNYGNHNYRLSKSSFYAICITRHGHSKTFPSMVQATKWLRTKGNVKHNTISVYMRLSRTCWNDVTDVYGYNARFVFPKGKTLQLNLFRLPKPPQQLKLF